MDSYRALIEITGEQSNSLPRATPGVVKERQYSAAYLDDAPNSDRTIVLRKRIVEGSRRFLEKRYVIKTI